MIRSACARMCAGFFRCGRFDIPRMFLNNEIKAGYCTYHMETGQDRIMQKYQYLSSCLNKEGLLQKDTLFLMPGKIILNAEGEPVSSSFFDRTDAEYALFTHGLYSLRYAGRKQDLKASIDDMAQMFGRTVYSRKAPERKDCACLIHDRGFFVTARYEKELTAAAVLMEKACRTEILAEKIGFVRYLNPALCEAEHLVYLLKYSKHEKEAADERE